MGPEPTYADVKISDRFMLRHGLAVRVIALLRNNALSRKQPEQDDRNCTGRKHEHPS